MFAKPPKYRAEQQAKLDNMTQPASRTERADRRRKESQARWERERRSDRIRRTCRGSAGAQKVTSEHEGHGDSTKKRSHDDDHDWIFGWAERYREEFRIWTLGS